MFKKLNKRAQSTAEYVIILGLVVGAVVAMQSYIKRGMQGRIRDAVDFADQGEQAQHDGATMPDAVVDFTGDQYEPYYLESNFNSNRNSTVAEELLDGSAVDRTTTADHSSRSGNQTIVGNRHNVSINE